MSEFYDVVGTSKYDQLLSDPRGADPISIPCKPGNGSIKRGTVMYRDESDMWLPAANENVVATNQLVVLNADVETGDAPGPGETATAPEAAAYRAGHFVAGRVTLKSGAALSEANKVVLRLQGIVFNVKEGTGTFDNKVTGE